MHGRARHPSTRHLEPVRKAMNERAAVGIVCSIGKASDGRVRLTMEDAESSGGERISWTITRLFTWKDYDRQQFLLTDLSEKDLADIGLSLVARLAALAESPEE